MAEIDTTERGAAAAVSDKQAKLAKRMAAAAAPTAAAEAPNGAAKKPKRVTPVVPEHAAAITVADSTFHPDAPAVAPVVVAPAPPARLKTYTWTDVTGKFPYHVVCIATAASPEAAVQLIAGAYGPRPMGRQLLLEDIVPLELDSTTPRVRIIDLSEN